MPGLQSAVSPASSGPHSWTVACSEVTCLSLSFRKLAKISNLEPFVNLQQLQLDNNQLKKIANLDHLVRVHPYSSRGRPCSMQAASDPPARRCSHASL